MEMTRRQMLLASPKLAFFGALFTTIGLLLAVTALLTIVELPVALIAGRFYVAEISAAAGHKLLEALP